MPCCMASTALITPAMPAVSSVWPMLAFTLVIGIFFPAGKCLVSTLGQRVELGGVAQLRRRGVGFDVFEVWPMSSPSR